MRHRYGFLDPDLIRQLLSELGLRRLFNHLLLQSGGDVEEAMRWMRALQEQGYIDPDVDNKSGDKGFFSRFKFWGGSSDKNKNEQYRVLVKDEGERAQVNVLNKDGAAERSATANRILTLLYDQLK